VGLPLTYGYPDQNRTVDHICYISDLPKLHSHYPEWRLEYDIPRIITEIVSHQVATLSSRRNTAAPIVHPPSAWLDSPVDTRPKGDPAGF